MRLAFEGLVQVTPVHDVRPLAGAVALTSGVPVGLFNPVFAFDPIDDPPALVDAVCALDRPFTLYFRDEVNAALVEACDAQPALIEHHRPPIMVLSTAPTPPSPPGGLSIDEVTLDTLEDLAHVLSLGFGMPPELVAMVVTPAFLERGPFTTYLATLDGTPVATAASFRDGHGTRGIYNVATVPDARGRGVGAAVTVAAAAWSPGDVVVLQATEQGRPVYERLGFDTPARYRQYERRDVDGH